MSIVLWALFSVALCGLCSVLEGVLLSVRVTALIERAHDKGAARLLAIKRGDIGDAISAILIVNTLAGTVGPGFVGAAAAKTWGDAGVGVASAVLTVLLLFCAEIGPKTYAATHAAALAGPVGRVLGVLMTALKPALFVSRLVTRWLAGAEGEAITRPGLARFIAHAPAAGVIAPGESRVISHMLFAHDVMLGDVVTPLADVVALDGALPARALAGRPEVRGFARIPLRDGDALPAYVDLREALYALLKDAGDPPLSAFAHPLPQLPDSLRLGEAIERLLDSGHSMGAVTGVAGIVTLEDLFEALLGFAITDEAEDVARLRPAIARIRRERLLSLKARREAWASRSDAV